MKTKLLTEDSTPWCLSALLYENLSTFYCTIRTGLKQKCWNHHVCSCQCVLKKDQNDRFPPHTLYKGLWYYNTFMLFLEYILLASYLCKQLFFYVHMCMYMRRCGSLYLVGIRPLALVLITAPCLLRPCNLPPLKCGFKKED